MKIIIYIAALFLLLIQCMICRCYHLNASQGGIVWFLTVIYGALMALHSTWGKK